MAFALLKLSIWKEKKAIDKINEQHNIYKGYKAEIFIKCRIIQRERLFPWRASRVALETSVLAARLLMTDKIGAAGQNGPLSQTENADSMHRGTRSVTQVFKSVWRN